MPPIGDLTVLVPIDVSEADAPSLSILTLLAPLEVVLLGYFPVPDQATPALIKSEYESVATARLDEIAAGRTDLTEVLVFTHDREATIDRISEQYECDAVLVGGDAESIDTILVPLRGDVNLDRIMSVVADLLRTNEATVTLFHSVPHGEDSSKGEFLLQGTADRLVEYGIDRGRIDWKLTEEGNPADDIVDLSKEYDLVVLGETEPSLRERIIGDFLSRATHSIDSPALIVRKTE